ncbi:hypothetical protein, variant 2 [Aphanomyces invadans]|uniref:Uncharacterized protein n=2 Tax=Aphanomyces invadans TaxID=157072 RepID=A0A024TZR8_9STRA|nr:hypothetical protein, variant 1 [Aphanomyces invadans]XP_008872005.1 hypothetical protein, variant 2 [Aphanomyces invadans]ETV99448.1 hypothetical protein, variant 1 [Aphanomyces invadans]ETV99449.1 hypothetical protein, variant 2 [Aphanomyces invadans]|eukprot:XP_008872004.1 hypothetical protein, variant 1 [Aphanomyces invadans]
MDCRTRSHGKPFPAPSKWMPAKSRKHLRVHIVHEIVSQWVEHRRPDLERGYFVQFGPEASAPSCRCGSGQWTHGRHALLVHVLRCKQRMRLASSKLLAELECQHIFKSKLEEAVRSERLESVGRIEKSCKHFHRLGQLARRFGRQCCGQGSTDAAAACAVPNQCGRCAQKECPSKVSREPQPRVLQAVPA